MPATTAPWPRGLRRSRPAGVGKIAFSFPHYSIRGAMEAEMKSEFFSMFGIPPTECEIEVREDDLNAPRLWFRSTGNPLVGLDLTGACQLQHLLTDAGEAKQANEIGQLITPKRSTFR